MKTAKTFVPALVIAFLLGCSGQYSWVELVEMSRLGDVVIQGGYETDSRDNGRPVRLIAAALEVPDEVFREAFAGVPHRPATHRTPSESEQGGVDEGARDSWSHQ